MKVVCPDDEIGGQGNDGRKPQRPFQPIAPTGVFCRHPKPGQRQKRNAQKLDIGPEQFSGQGGAGEFKNQAAAPQNEGEHGDGEGGRRWPVAVTPGINAQSRQDEGGCCQGE